MGTPYLCSLAERYIDPNSSRLSQDVVDLQPFLKCHSAGDGLPVNIDSTQIQNMYWCIRCILYSFGCFLVNKLVDMENLMFSGSENALHSSCTFAK